MVALFAAGTSDVYDLAVEGQPEYFANGVLVHNSTRNGLYAFKEIETSMPKNYFVSERMEQFQEQYEKDFGARLTDPTRLWMVAQTQSAAYEKVTGSKQASFNVPSSRNIRRRFQ